MKDDKDPGEEECLLDLMTACSRLPPLNPFPFLMAAKKKEEVRKKNSAPSWLDEIVSEVLALTGRRSRVGRGAPLRIVGFYCPKLGCWVAQPLEIRTRGLGEDYEAALKRLTTTLSEEPVEMVRFPGEAEAGYFFLFYWCLFFRPVPGVVVDIAIYPGECEYYDVMFHPWIASQGPAKEDRSENRGALPSTREELERFVRRLRPGCLDPDG